MRLLCFLALVAAAATRVSAQQSPIITLANGQQVQGLATELGYQFVGIPYGAPPIGALRWADAQPAAVQPGVLNATVFGAGCPQTCVLPPHTCPATTSEDCLSLNVFTPATALGDDDAPLPVMFFIHGGNFKQGAGGSDLYDASAVAAQNRAVFVTINYRLGALSALVGRDPAGTLHGNYGITDQRLALRWVQANIAQFGGDASNVAIFGQSAGAVSVAIHALSPLSVGLFARGIMQSLPFGVPLRSTADAQDYSSGFAKFANCSIDDFECLRALSVDQVLNAQDKCQRDPFIDPNLLEIFMPTTPHWGPGSEIAANPFDAFRSGALGGAVPIVIGTTHDEAVPFIYGAFGKPVGKVEYEILLGVIFGLKSVTPLNKYYPPPANTTDYRAHIAVIATHAIFVCPTRNATRAAAASGTRAWSYVYDHVASFSSSMWGGNYTFCDNQVCHGADLPFVFQPPAAASFGDVFTPPELATAQLMGNFWSLFGASGAPGAAWPAYTEANQLPQMYFSVPDSRVQHDYLAPTCNFWDDVIGYQWS